MMDRRTLTGIMSALLLGSAPGGWCAESADNPYVDIVSRNAFALKPPPPPPDPTTNPPPASPVEVFLTGISTLGNTKKVLLQITEKGPNKKPDFPPPLVEGDVQGRVEVVSINVDKGEVAVKIDGNERTLTFDKDAPKPGGGAAAGAGPGNPGGIIPLPGVTSGAGAAAALQQAASANPSGTYGVVVGGGSGPAAASSTAKTTGAANPVSTGGSAGLSSYALGGTANASAIPARPLRIDAGAGGVYVGGALPADGSSGGTAGSTGASTATQTTPAMTREQAWAHIEEQRRLINEAEGLGVIPRNKFPPLPPTPFSPSPPAPGGNNPVVPPVPGH